MSGDRSNTSKALGLQAHEGRMKTRLVACLFLLSGARSAACAQPADAGAPAVVESSATERTVFLLHGILRTDRAMRRLEKTLASRGFRVVNLRYPSRSRTIEEHADWLAGQVSEKGRGDLYFAGHSLGSIIIRRYLAVYRPANAKRFVMIAPPNHGSVLADKAAKLGVYRWIYGPKAGMELRSSNENFWRSLPPPPIEFGILAGGLGDGKGFERALPGDDDGIVTVEEARLEGAKELRLLPFQHSLILLRKKTAVMTADFLENGSFSRQ